MRYTKYNVENSEEKTMLQKIGLLLLCVAFYGFVGCTNEVLGKMAEEDKYADITARGGMLIAVSHLDDLVFTDVNTGQKLEYTNLYSAKGETTYPVTGVKVDKVDRFGITMPAVLFLSEKKVDNKIVGHTRAVSGQVPADTNKMVFRTRYKLEDGELILY